MAASMLRAGLLAILGAAAPQDGDETARYLRPSSKGPIPECAISITKGEKGRTISSVTGRGPSALTVTARYDAAETLIEAEASVGTGAEKKSAALSVAGGRAIVRRKDKEAQEFDAPAGVIVTSAPDWTDTFLLCRRYDRSKGGKQEFPGLWIHPEQAAQRLTFTAEKLGSVTVEHGGEKIELVRLALRLRGNSAYVAWSDPKGRMIKLVSMPYKEGGTELVLEGFETPAAGLKPE